MSNLVLPSDPCPSGMARGGPCAELSSRSYDRALDGACVRLERRAVKVAGVVLRGLGGCEPTWLPGGLRGLSMINKRLEIGKQHP